MGEDAPAGASKRARIVTERVASLGIDEAMVDRLVRTFYGRVRRDPLLGPVFAAKVVDWEAHLERMRSFWSSVALMTGRYHGDPMAAHRPLPVDLAHFERWLEIWSAVADEVCTAAAAAFFRDRARRIAGSLASGVAAARAAALGPDGA